MQITPKSAETTSGKISKIPRIITIKKIKIDLLGSALSMILVVDHSRGIMSLFVLRFLIDSLVP